MQAGRLVRIAAPAELAITDEWFREALDLSTSTRSERGAPAGDGSAFEPDRRMPPELRLGVRLQAVRTTTTLRASRAAHGPA